MSYTMYTPLNVWLDPASVTDVVAYIQNYLSENTIYSEEEIEELIHDYLEAHPELIGGVQSVNGKTGTVVLTASDINTANNVTIESVLASLSSQISSIASSVSTNTANITNLTGRVSTAETQIDSEVTVRANADTALSNRINALQGAVGSPLKADAVASMTDTSKIYVYTGSETGYTNGNWYYYNGSAWVSGGVYNAVAINTDSTLTVAGMAADAKATGDELNNLKSAFQMTDNLFYLSPLLDYPYTEKGITITPNDDGSFILNGTASSTFRITLANAANPDDTWIQAGEYSFGWSIVSGSSSVVSNAGVSVRAITDSTVALNLSTILSNTLTFTEAGKCFVRVGKDITCSNLRLKVMINRGTTLLPYIKHGESAIDIVARDDTNRAENALTSSTVYPMVVGTRDTLGQGGCLNDNNYVWMRALSNNSCGLYGLNIITGVPIQKGNISTDDVLGHCNDMTYNPNTKKYYVSTMLETGALGVLSDTYTYESSIILTDGNGDPVVTHGIAYDRIHDEYLAASETSDAVYVYNSSFVYQRTITLSSQITLTKQGIETDGCYIYYPLSNTDYICVIRTYTITGEFVSDTEIVQISGKEPEGLAYDWNAGYFLLNANSKDVSLSTLYCVCPNNFAYHSIGATLFALKYQYSK